MSDEGARPEPEPTAQPARAPEAPAPSPTTGWQPPVASGATAGARRGGAAFGILLIVIGIVVLIGRFVPWFDVVRLWPLIVVGSGLFQIFRPRGDVWIKRAAEGLGSVTVGLVLLGNTFGYIPWSVWVTVISLWPLLLVALGIELLGRGLHQDWLRAASNIVLILGLLYAVFVLGTGWSGTETPVFGVSSGSAFAFASSEPHDPAVTKGDAEIKVGAVRLTVGAGDQLAAISGDARGGDEPTLRTSTSTPDAVSVTVSEQPGRVFIVPSSQRTLDVWLDREITWSRLRLNVGAVEGEADLRELAVQAIDANVGASDLRLRIGKKAPDVTVNVSGGATSVTIFVPADAGVRVDARSGLSNVGVPASFRRLSGVPGFGESTWTADGSGGPSIDVTMQSGVANLTIETY